MNKIQIKSIYGIVLFEHECENNNIKITLGQANLSGANLSGADLREADLCRADLRRANLSEANLSGADLCRADLRRANLSRADLSGANLSRADLSGAYLREANLSGADLRGADLRGATLSGANLSGADLRGADLENITINEYTSMFLLACPEEGSFIGYKKASGKIIKLLILEDSKRSSSTSLKCRCSKAKVLSITELDGSKSITDEIPSNFDKNFVYKVGETVEVIDFDENRWNECAPGIHFFMNRLTAVNY